MDNKNVETNPLSNQSQTTTALICVDKPIEEENTMSVDKPIKMCAPIVLLFAEYYGYISPLLEWATDFASGKKITSLQKRLIELDAQVIASKLKQEEDIKDIRETYIMLHDLVFGKYERILNPLLEEYDDLPF